MFTSVTPHPVIPDGPERSGLARFWHQVGPGSRKRYALARIEAERLAALRYEWQEACRHVGLGLMILSAVLRLAEAGTLRLVLGAIGLVVPSADWPLPPATLDALRATARAMSRELGAQTWPPLGNSSPAA